MLKIVGEAQQQKSYEESEESTSADSSLSPREQKVRQIAAERQKVFRSSPITYTRNKKYQSSTLFYRRRLTSNQTQISNIHDDDLNVKYMEPVMYGNPQTSSQAEDYKRQTAKYRKDVLG